MTIKKWFQTKKQIIQIADKLAESNEALERMLHLEFQKLEQSSLYYVYYPDMSIKEMKRITNTYDELRRRGRWTYPMVIFSSTEFEELKKEQLQELLTKCK